VTVSYGPAGDQTLRLSVRDTGRGIAADKLSRLFTPFDRLGAEQSSVEGTGLGLALCQRLMQAMNGSIGASSSIGSGSTFWIEIPTAESPLAKLPGETRPSLLRGPAGSAARRTILYIEDNLSNLTLMEQMLADQPEVELITTMQGRLGLELAVKHNPDLILLDLHLPDVPGWDVLAELKRNLATCHIPVVVLSADATKRQIDRLMAGGARSYLTKPLDVAEFYRALEEATITPKLENAACAAA
jgi:CheY-like chemotaxis protein